MQQTGRPVLVLTKKSNGIAKGSGRSVAALNLFDMLSGMREMFTSFGGHHAAVGLSVPIDHLSMLQERMNQYVVDNRIDLSSGIPLPIDEELSLAEITTNFIESLKILAPFGTDNPIPKFLITNISADNGRQIGTENQHLKVSLTDGENGQLDVIGFGFGSQLVEFESEGLAVVGQLSVNEWNGKKKPQLMLEDFEVNGIQLFDLRSKKNRQGLILDAQTLGVAFSDKLPSEIERFCPNVHVYQTLDDLTAFFGSGNYTQLAFLDCPSEKELLRKIIQEIPVNRIYLILVSTEDAYLDGVGTREQYGRLFQLINQQNGIDIRYKLPMVANYLQIPEKLLIFMIQVFFDLKFVTIKDGVLKKVPDPENKPLTESVLYQQRLAKIKTEEDLLMSDLSTIRKWLIS